MSGRYDFDRIIPRENTRSVKFDYRKEYFGTPEVLPMWVADMDFPTPDFVLDALRKRTEHEILGYSIRPESFYRSILEWLDKRHNWTPHRDWIVFSPGIVPALNICVLSCTRPGDQIIIQPPVYHPFHTAVKDHGRELVFNQLREENGYYRIDTEDLRKKITGKTRMLILCNPHNPVSRVWTKEELTEIAEIALEHKLLVIADEIHSDLVMEGHRHIPFASLSPEVSRLTITCMSPSKTFNMAGLSTAYVVIEDPEIRKSFSRWIDSLHLWLGNVFGNLALEVAYREGAGWLDQLLEYLKANFNWLENTLSRELPYLKLSPPEGTYLGWLDFRQLDMPGEKIHEFLVNSAGVGFNEGSSFGPGGEGFERINLACPRSVLQLAMIKITEALKEL